MRQVVCTCDICREVRPEKELYQVKVRSLRFIDYVNQEEIFADRKKIDICDYCIAKFKDFIRKEKRKNTYSEEETAKDKLKMILEV